MKDYETFFKELNIEASKMQDSNDEIDSSLLQIARDTINADNATSFDDFLKTFASLNYLNFAVKKDKTIGYWFKKYVETNIRKVKDLKIENISLFYDNKDKVTYVKFYSFIFSFHYVSYKDTEFKNLLANEEPIIFDNIRKQRCAGMILKSVIDFINK